MKIGIIGSGKVGGALGNGWAEKSLAWCELLTKSRSARPTNYLGGTGLCDPFDWPSLRFTATREQA